jgi:hypothetical protein
MMGGEHDIVDIDAFQAMLQVKHEHAADGGSADAKAMDSIRAADYIHKSSDTQARFAQVTNSSMVVMVMMMLL